MDTEKNIFEIASRRKFRFSFKGLISVEDLWDLSVKDLDSIFKGLNSQLKQEKEESLLDTKTKENEELDQKIQIIKHIVDIKVNEEKSKIDARKRKAQKQKLYELMEAKKDEDLKNKSVEEIQKLIDEIED